MLPRMRQTWDLDSFFLVHVGVRSSLPHDGTRARETIWQWPLSQLMLLAEI